jgi:Flp pilus assembly protein TadB
MSPDAAFLGLLGVGVGLGLTLITAGWRGRSRPRAGARGRRPVRAVHGVAGRRAAVALAAAVAAAVVTGWVAGGILAGLATLTLPGLGRDRHAARRLERMEAVATWTEMLRDTLAAAAGLEQTILATATVAPAALRAEVQELAARVRRGDRLPDALRGFGEQVADPTCDLVVSALVLASEHQARQLADLLGELATEAREQVAMRLRVEAGRARTRTSVRVIVGTTLAFAAGLILLNRPFLQPYDGPGGQLVLLLVGSLFGLPFAWLARIGHIAEPGRVLTGAPGSDPDGGDHSRPGSGRSDPGRVERSSGRQVSA